MLNLALTRNCALLVAVALATIDEMRVVCGKPR